MQIALAQVRPKKADYAENVMRLTRVLVQAAEWPDPPGLVVFGESVMSGYFLEGGVQEEAVTAGTLFADLAAAHAAAGIPPVDVCVGFYERRLDRVFNSALYATLGGSDAGIRHVHRKIFLPTYGLFDEQRFVEAGTSVAAFDTAWGRVAILVCEDVWHGVAASMAALDGAQLILVPSASPARGTSPTPEGRPNSVEAWERLVTRVAEEHGTYVALVQLAGFEGGKGFQGHSVLVRPDGTIACRAPGFSESVVRGDLDHAALARARAEQPLVGDLEAKLPGLLAGRPGFHAPGAGWEEAEREPLAARAVTASDLSVARPEPCPDPLTMDAALVEHWLVEFLREEMVSRRGFTTGIVGLSGGVDSAVTCALAVRALGAGNVRAVNMPYATSSPEGRDHARAVAEYLGVELQTIDITVAVDAIVSAVDAEADAHRRGNVMARMRMITLFDLAAKHRALPLGTGNKSERLLGYFTWHGDDAPPMNPLGDLFKTQVLQLARHLGIPEAVVTKPPSADLVSGQTDEGDLGIPYARADVILHWLLAGYTPPEVATMGFADDEIGRVKRRLDATHWKRRPPTVAVVSRSAIGESWLRPVDY